MTESPRTKIGLIRNDIVRMSGIVSHQMGQALDAFVRYDDALAASVVEQDDQVDSLNLRVESAAFDAAGLPRLSPGDRRAAISALKVAINLERIGDAATHIGKRIAIMRRENVAPYPYELEFAKSLVMESIDEAVRAYLDEDLELAKRACALEPELDSLYVEGLGNIRRRTFDDPSTIDYSLHLLAVLKYLEKVGDYILNIGEQAIFLVTGNRMQFSQFQQLDHLLHQVGEQDAYAPFHDGISGATVGRVHTEERPLLFKEGSRRKIQEEVDGTDAWNEIDAGLVPQIVSSITYKDRQALLREFVDGTLLSQVYSSGNRAQQRAMTAMLCGTLGHLWERTLKEEAPDPRYVRQIRTRLREVYALHPSLQAVAGAPMRRGGVRVQPLDELLEAAEGLEADLAPSFSVWLHGDLNSNNVVYNRQKDGLQFIDVHRSAYGDYVQDLTVFLVGLRRVPDLSPHVRRQLRDVHARVRAFAREFAARHGDTNVERRLLLGEARSCITSARIVLQPNLAEQLFRRGRQALQELVNHG